MSKIKLFINTEADFYYFIPSPHFSALDMIKWKFNKIAGRFYKYPFPTRNGLIGMVRILKKYKFPAIFCICGHLYLKSCTGKHNFSKIAPRNPWYFNKIGKNWYYWDKGGDYKTKPGLYLGDFIEKEMKSVPFFEFGLHGFAHEALTLEKKEVVEEIIKEGIISASKVGVKITSFAAPFNMIEDIKEPNKIFNILKKYKIKNIQYAGKDDGLKSLHGFHSGGIKKKKGLILYGVDFSLDGTDDYKKIKEVIKQIRNSKKSRIVIMTHDFTWKDLNKFEFLIKNIRKNLLFTNKNYIAA